MNEMQLILDYTIQHFEANKLVNTVTNYVSDEIDTNHDTLYPLVNIDYTGATINEDEVICSLSITALNQLDIYQTTTDSKLKVDTNHFDVINETFSICQTFINSFRQYNSSGIEMLTVSALEPINNDFVNGLSGHEFTIELTLPNLGSSCQTE